MAGQLGYCGLDRGRRPLTGEEIRGCWESLSVATETSVPLTIAAARSGEDRPPLEFVEVGAVASSDLGDEISDAAPLAPGTHPATETSWSLWGDLET